MSPRFNCIFCICLLASCAALQAQSYVTASDVHLVNKFLDQPVLLADPLKCEIKPLQPRLDFAFRFDVAFLVGCPIKEFAGEASSLLIYIRVTPEKGPRTILGEGYTLPKASDATRARTPIAKLKQEFELSGAIAVGEGRYVVEALVADKRTARMCVKRWNVTAQRKRGERSVPVALQPDTVAPMTILPWKGTSEQNTAGTRITVLLDAAPIYPFAQKLHAWDRSFLLTTLSSVLEQINCQSVKVIAFNLDQQKEVFREEHFTPAGFQQLAHAMRNLELGTVSYQVLQKKAGYSELLAQLADEQRTQAPPPDVVIFVGPQTHFDAKITKQSLPASTGGPPFFYLEFMPPWLLGSEFPDSIEYITKALDGTSFKIHSPNELAGAMQKIALEVKPEAKKRNENPKPAPGTR